MLKTLALPVVADALGCLKVVPYSWIIVVKASSTVYSIEVWVEGKDDHSVAAATQWLLLIDSLVDNIQQVSSSWLKDWGCACRCNGNAGKSNTIQTHHHVLSRKFS